MRGWCRYTEELELRSRAVDLGDLRRVLGVNALELLTACRADLHQLLRALELEVMRVEHGLGRDELRSRFRDRRAIDLSHHLALAYASAELRDHSRDTSIDERCHRDLPVAIGLDHAWQTNVRGGRPGRDCCRPQPRALHRFRSQRDDDFARGCACRPGWRASRR